MLPTPSQYLNYAKTYIMSYLGVPLAYAIIDTSSILFGIRYKKDVFEIASEKYPLRKQLISDGIISELEKMASYKGTKANEAKIALKILRHKNLKVDNKTEYVDSWILDTASKNADSLVITNDTKLFKNLKSKGIEAKKLSKSGELR